MTPVVPEPRQEGPTLGETVRELRLGAHASIEELADATRIQKKYLLALEADSHKDLPDPTYVRHFLKAIAETLGGDPQALIARYRPPEEEPALTPPAPPSALAFLVPTKLVARAGVVALVLLVLALLGFQARAIIAPPELVVDTPADAQTLTEPVVRVSGSVRGRNAEVRINDERVYPDAQGNFSLEIDLRQGVNLIKIAAKKPRSAEVAVYRQVVIQAAAPTPTSTPAR